MSEAASDSLLWIKNELDHTLARAREALESYVERPENDAALAQCLELLHQVQGTLRIVEVYGAAMLAEEMEAVVQGLRSGELMRSDAAFEVLVRAMLQLPDYLERVISGRRDMPMALLSLLNDLRAVRGQALLSESALFAYNLAGRSASVMGHAPAPGAVDIRSLAAKLRAKFQIALLGWYKGEHSEQHLAEMAEAAEKLEQAATTPAVFELWWVVGGVIEGLREGSIEADVGLKQLLGQVDRQIKRLADRGEAPLTDDPASELVNSLLYYIGRAQSQGKRIAAIKESFKLGELLPGEREIAETRARISGPNAGLIRTVSGALKEDIGRVKDTLDLYVRTHKTDVAELAPLDPILKKVGDTLGVLELPDLRALLEQQRTTLGQILAGRRPADGAALMDMAAGIVSVESRLEAAMLELLASGGTPARDAGAPALQEERSAVVRGSIINLARIKEAIVEFVNDPTKASSLDPLPGRIREIQGSLRFLDMERVAVVLESVRQYIRQHLLAGSGVPPQNELDRMADAIVSVEFYLEAIQQGRGNPLSMLDNAEACVATLGFPIGHAYSDAPASPEPATDEVSILGLESSVVEPENIVIEPLAPELAEAPAAEPPRPPAEPAAEETISLASPPMPAPVPQASLPAVAPASPQTDVDPEILTVFLEEAQEELESLRQQFPRWRSNPADREALITVRRSFHTLKGSGRMVGAQLIGEFAWALENMLNHVIDGMLEPSEGMFELVERALGVLPALVEELKTGAEPKTDVRALMQAAAAYSRGEAASAGTPVKSAPRKREHPTPPVANLDEVEAIAPAVKLREIFTREAERHLGVLSGFLEAAGAGSTSRRAPSDELVRAMHTLQGSASMAGVDALAALTEPVQRELMEMRARADKLSDSGLAVLGEVLAEARAMTAAFGTGREVPAASPELLARIEPALRPVLAPAPTAPASPADAPRQVTLAQLKGYDPDLAGIFFDEANELLDSTDETLHQWSRNRGDAHCVTQLQRNLHTLKGGARMAGLSPMGDLSHELETALTDIVDGRLAVSTEILALLNRAVDRLHRILEQSYANKPIVDAGDLIEELRRLHAGELEAGGESGHPEEPVVVSAPPLAPPPPPPPEEPAPVSSEAAPTPAVAAEAALGGAAERRSGSRIQHELVRVRADLLENALNAAGEVGIFRARLEQEVHSINFNLGELEQTVERVRDQLRKLEIETEAQILYRFQQEGGDREHPEFDPLELDRYSLLQQLSRALGESVGDLTSLQALLLGQARDAGALLVQQSRAGSELQDGLMRTRMVPLSRHAQRLRRVVRQTAEELHKQVEFKLAGSEVELDRQVLERVLAPLEHMLRNSVVHGIEKPELRQRAGKPATGTVTVHVDHEGSEVVIEVSDDGAGLNLAAIRRKAAEMDLIPANAQLDQRSTMAFILEPGFSTAPQLNQSAGRGVGMDVVASEVKQLGGTLKIDSVAGRGAKFTIRLPFTLSIVRALLVTVAEQPYAIPLPSIEGIARVPRAEIERLLASDTPAYLYGGRPYQLQYLSLLLGFGAGPLPAELASVPLLLVRTGERDLALIAEGMQGSREVVVKSVGPQVGSIPGISGATILGDGSIMLILDVTGLARNSAHAGDAQAQTRAAHDEDRRKCAIVVDDSITVRRVTQRLLERAGMRVLTAKDGVDALALLQENRPDVMLLDIEMPRMDGYEVAQYLRNDARFRELPIIMITSRAGEKHRRRAEELGVNRYLGKPFQEAELLDNIRALIGSPSHAPGPGE
ncbi:MAG: Hpt domain-containing protein [Gammaproteobacteria bacterium]